VERRAQVNGMNQNIRVEQGRRHSSRLFVDTISAERPEDFPLYRAQRVRGEAKGRRTTTAGLPSTLPWLPFPRQGFTLFHLPFIVNARGLAIANHKHQPAAPEGGGTLHDPALHSARHRTNMIHITSYRDTLFNYLHMMTRCQSNCYVLPTSARGRLTGTI
jgi:hypothetical protein